MVTRWLTTGVVDHVPTTVFDHCPKLMRLYRAPWASTPASRYSVGAVGGLTRDASRRRVGACANDPTPVDVPGSTAAAPQRSIDQLRLRSGTGRDHLRDRGRSASCRRARAGIRWACGRCSSGRARRRPSSALLGSPCCSMFISGIVPPPWPMVPSGRRSACLEARFSAVSSQGASDGAFQPVAQDPEARFPARPSGTKVTLALYGALSSSSVFSSQRRLVAVDQRRQAQRQLEGGVGPQHVAGVAEFGEALAPVTESVGRQVRLSSASSGSVVVGRLAVPSAPQAQGSASRPRRRGSARWPAPARYDRRESRSESSPAAAVRCRVLRAGRAPGAGCESSTAPGPRHRRSEYPRSGSRP